MIWYRICRNRGESRGPRFHRIVLDLKLYLSLFLWFAATLSFMGAPATLAHARKKDALQYGEGLIVNIPLPEPEVAQVVEEVSQNTIIRGTKEYNKDEYVAAAVAMKSTPVFKPWTEGGKVFYKVRKQALDPLNFKDSQDVGTLAVRYIVQPQGEKNTVLRIDALFVEDFRHIVHQSNGSVEGAEYKDIQDRLASVELVKKETEDALEAKKNRQAKQAFSSSRDSSSREQSDQDNEAPRYNSSSNSNDELRHEEVLGTPAATALDSADSTNANSASAAGSAADKFSAASQGLGGPSAFEQSGATLEQYVANLRRQVARLVKQPGAPLKSAPFHTASTMTSLDPGAEVLILITTPYWYGVETHDGEHGWLRRDQLEPMP